MIRHERSNAVSPAPTDNLVPRQPCSQTTLFPDNPVSRNLFQQNSSNSTGAHRSSPAAIIDRGLLRAGWYSTPHCAERPASSCHRQRNFRVQTGVRPLAGWPHRGVPARHLREFAAPSLPPNFSLPMGTRQCLHHRQRNMPGLIVGPTDRWPGKGKPCQEDSRAESGANHSANFIPFLKNKRFACCSSPELPIKEVGQSLPVLGDYLLRSVQSLSSLFSPPYSGTLP